jgi:phospholipid-translocating ATPase
MKADPDQLLLQDHHLDDSNVLVSHLQQVSRLCRSPDLADMYSFDATYLFEYTFLLLYTLVFTSLPVGIMGAFEQDTNAAASMAFPALYMRGVKGLDYTRRRFWIYMADGLYQSAIIFFIPFLAYGTAAPWSASGRDTCGLYDLGTTIACAGVISANLYVGINTRYWTWITLVVYFFSTLAIYIWIPVYSYLAALPYNGEVAILFSTFSFWAVTVITVFLAVGPRFLVSSLRQSYLPRDKDIVREAWVAGDLKEQLGIKHRRDRRRAEVEAKAVGGDRPASFVDHLHQALGAVDREDERGYYHAAAMASPQKDIGRSPLMSGNSTPRSPFSYPPPSPALLNLDHSPSPRPTVPPPLLIQRHDDPPQMSPSPTGAYDLQIQQNGTLGTPTSPYSYISPGAVDKYTLASEEVKRLSKASVDLKRASLSPQGNRTLPGNNNGGSQRNSRLSISPQKRSSWPALGDMLGVPDRAGSPVRGSHEGVRGYGGHESMDFSQASGWDESRRNTMMDVDLTEDEGYGEANALPRRTEEKGKGGFAV